MTTQGARVLIVLIAILVAIPIARAQWLLGWKAQTKVKDATPAVCKIDSLRSTQKVQLARVPNYFFRPFPNRNWVSYNDSAHNYLVDLETGKEINLPGRFDAVPTQDERFLLVPNVNKDNNPTSMRFYSMKDIEEAFANDNSADTIDPVYIDKSVTAVYQSTGLMPAKDGTPERIRMVAGTSKLVMRDYEVKTHSNGQSEIEPMGDVKPLCPGHDLALPMISRDGRELAAFDKKAEVTKIFKINDDGKCEDDPLNLGIRTGKVDFSFNGEDIAFHVSNNDVESEVAQSGQYTGTPSGNMAMNAYVYNRRTKKLKRLSNNVDANSEYPSFRRDGKIVYIHIDYDSASDTPNPSLAVVDPIEAEGVNFTRASGGESDSSCQTPQERSFHSTLALGSLWSSLCTEHVKELSVTSATLNALSLDPDECARLVRRYWKKRKLELLEAKKIVSAKEVNARVLVELSVNDLLAACPGREVGRSATKAAAQAKRPAPKKPLVKLEKVAFKYDGAIPRSCLGCHATFEWRDPVKMKPRIAEIRRRITIADKNHPQHMPLDGELTAREAAEFDVYLKSIEAAPAEDQD